MPSGVQYTATQTGTLASIPLQGAVDLMVSVTPTLMSDKSRCICVCMNVCTYIDSLECVCM